jgi:hypothetical protein
MSFRRGFRGSKHSAYPCCVFGCCWFVLVGRPETGPAGGQAWRGSMCRMNFSYYRPSVGVAGAGGRQARHTFKGPLQGRRERQGVRQCWHCSLACCLTLYAVLASPVILRPREP